MALWILVRQELMALQYAVADGYVVTSTRLNGSYGNYIIIAHYNGLYTLYAHGQDGSRKVSAGQTVKKDNKL